MEILTIVGAKKLELVRYTFWILIYFHSPWCNNACIIVKVARIVENNAHNDRERFDKRRLSCVMIYYHHASVSVGGREEALSRWTRWCVAMLYETV